MFGTFTIYIYIVIEPKTVHDMKKVDIIELKANISESGYKIMGVYKKMNISKSTFNRRVISGYFKPSEIKVLKQLKLIK